jgi:hypothetical protein
MKKTWLFIEMLFALIAVLLGLAACYYIFPKRVDHDVWDILTAIGTVGAAAAAVWIATSEARRRNNTDIDIARLTAAGMKGRVFLAWNKVNSVLALFENLRQTGGAPANFQIARTEIEKACTWTVADLIPLAPLPHHCAINLAKAIGQMHQCIDRLNIAPLAGELDTTEGSKNAADSAWRLLKPASIFLADALAVCESASNAGKTV